MSIKDLLEMPIIDLIAWYLKFIFLFIIPSVFLIIMLAGALLGLIKTIRQ